MAFLYDYLTESERESLKETMSADIEELRIMNAFEAVELKHELDMQQIETKATFEGYDEAKLSLAYGREHEIYMEGVKEVFNKFIEWLKGIIKAIFKIKDDTNKIPNEVLQDMGEVEIDDNPSKVKKILGELGQFVTEITTRPVDNDKDNREFSMFKTLLAGGGTLTAIVGAITGYKKIKTKVKATEAKKDSEEIANESNKLLDKLKALAAKAPENVKNVVTAIGNFIKNICLGLVNNIKSVLGKKSGNSEADAEQPKEGTSDNASAEAKGEDEKKDDGGNEGKKEDEKSSETPATDKPSDEGKKEPEPAKGEKPDDKSAKSKLDAIVRIAVKEKFFGDKSIQKEFKKLNKEKQKNPDFKFPKSFYEHILSAYEKAYPDRRNQVKMLLNALSTVYTEFVWDFVDCDALVESFGDIDDSDDDIFEFTSNIEEADNIVALLESAFN